MSTERKTAFPIIALFMKAFGWSKFQARRAVQEIEDPQMAQRLYLAVAEFDVKARQEACRLVTGALGDTVLPEILNTVNLAKLPGPEADAAMIEQKNKARKNRRYEGAPRHVRKSKAADR